MRSVFDDCVAEPHAPRRLWEQSLIQMSTRKTQGLVWPRTQGKNAQLLCLRPRHATNLGCKPTRSRPSSFSGEVDGFHDSNTASTGRLSRGSPTVQLRQPNISNMRRNPQSKGAIGGVAGLIQMWLGLTVLPGVVLSVSWSNVNLRNETAHRPTEAFKLGLGRPFDQMADGSSARRLDVR